MIVKDRWLMLISSISALQKRDHYICWVRPSGAALVAEMSQLTSLEAVARVVTHSSTDGGGGCTRARRLNTSLRARVLSYERAPSSQLCRV